MDINVIRRKLLVKYPLFGSVIANTSFIPKTSISTAGTDGKIIYYNPSFIDSLSIDEQLFIFAHEICHIASNHIYRSEGKKQRLWNIATDGVINQLLKKDGLPLVDGVVDIKEAIGFDAESLYELLLKEELDPEDNKNQLPNNEHDNQNNTSENNGTNQEVPDDSDDKEQPNESNDEKSNSQDGNSDTEVIDDKSDLDSEDELSDDVGHDTHSMWKEAIEKKHQEGQNQNESSNQSSDQTNNEDESEEINEQELFKNNEEERNKNLEELRKSIVRRSYSSGGETSNFIRNVNDIGFAKPIIDWRYVLREAIKRDIDWSYENATIEDGVITPHLEEFDIPETEIVLDTSGSIDDTLLRNFLRECKNIISTSKVKVGCFDTRFYGFTEIKDVSDIDSIKFEGGGGTNFDAAVNAFTDRVDNKIIFTDGYGLMPIKPVDAIWIVFGDAIINPPGGRVIHIDDEQLDRLEQRDMVPQHRRIR